MTSNQKTASPSEGAQPYSCPGCDLSGQSFAGQDLTNANLKGATLLGTSFKGVISLSGADLTGATMGGTDFSGCDLTNTIFSSPANFGTDPSRPTKFVSATVPFATLGTTWLYLDLTGADIVGLPQNLSSLEVSGAQLPAMAFAGKNLSNAHFFGANLVGADFRNCTLNNAVFTSLTNLAGAKFNGAEIPYGVFDTSTLTRTDFSGATLTNVSFLQTRMDGTIFEGRDLTTCSFSQPPRFSSDPARITSFKNATLNFSTLGIQWSCLDLTGATLVGLSASIDLTWLSARYTVLGALDLSGYTLNQADFTGATLTDTIFKGAKMTDVTFDGASGSRVHFDGATMIRASFQASPSPVSLRSCVFDNADLTDANFNQADLTNSHFIQSRLHGAVLTSTTLKGANMTGAQMGTQGLLFSITTPSAYQQFLTALNNNCTATVITVLTTNGVSVRRITISVPSPTQQGGTWVLADEDTSATYIVRKLSYSGQNLLSVFNTSAEHAWLGDAYMPGAILTSANLYGASASGVHLYGADSKLDSAILEAVDFSKSNLGTANLQQAPLYDAIFDDAILTNTHLEGAFLLPGQVGRGVSLQRANLQGAYLSGAKLYGANLQDAAVCMPLDEDPTASNGVGLHPVASKDVLYAAYIKELNQAGCLFTMDPKYEVDLQPGAPDPEFRLAFAEASQGLQLSSIAEISVIEYDLTYQIVDGNVDYVLIKGVSADDVISYLVLPSVSAIQPFSVPLADGQYLRVGPVATQLKKDVETGGHVTLSPSAHINSFQRAVMWQINDTAASYTVWEGYDESATRLLFVRPAIPNLEALFNTFGITLKRTTVTGDGGRWIVDNDSANPFNFTLGYVVFNVIQTSGMGPLDIYGSTMRIERLGDDDRMEFYDILSGPTQVSASNFDAGTIYPNGNKETIVDGQLQEEWMWAKAPPKPPTCVCTSGYYYCPANRSDQAESPTREHGEPVRTGYRLEVGE